MSAINGLNNGQLWMLVNMCRSTFRRAINSRIKLYTKGKVFVPPSGRGDGPLEKMRALVEIEKKLLDEANSRPADRAGSKARHEKPILHTIPIPNQVHGKIVHLQECMVLAKTHPLWKRSEDRGDE